LKKKHRASGNAVRNHEAQKYCSARRSRSLRPARDQGGSKGRGVRGVESKEREGNHQENVLLAGGREKEPEEAPKQAKGLSIGVYRISKGQKRHQNTWGGKGARGDRDQGRFGELQGARAPGMGGH